MPSWCASKHIKYRSSRVYLRGTPLTCVEWEHNENTSSVQLTLLINCIRLPTSPFQSRYSQDNDGETFVCMEKQRPFSVPFIHSFISFIFIHIIHIIHFTSRHVTFPPVPSRPVPSHPVPSRPRPVPSRPVPSRPVTSRHVTSRLTSRHHAVVSSCHHLIMSSCHFIPFHSIPFHSIRSFSIRIMHKVYGILCTCARLEPELSFACNPGATLGGQAGHYPTLQLRG